MDHLPDFVLEAFRFDELMLLGEMCLLAIDPCFSFSSWDKKSKTEGLPFVHLLLVLLPVLEALAESFVVGLRRAPEDTTTAEGRGLSTSQSVDHGVRGVFWGLPPDEEGLSS
jgi:hypothetical protein